MREKPLSSQVTPVVFRAQFYPEHSSASVSVWYSGAGAGTLAADTIFPSALDVSHGLGVSGSAGKVRDPQHPQGSEATRCV